ncbi:hypothetical protein GH714_043933 [Hevea brasiliensis]|uniref:Lysozyme n=1 Tax=Hevea brasiliensis TaxID=3981 RepID=A0A6A6K0Z9_HEVBR|nr:hypothetical protein GH714_043933 [Hevea brasiliensis]
MLSVTGETPRSRKATVTALVARWFFCLHWNVDDPINDLALSGKEAGATVYAVTKGTITKPEAIELRIATGKGASDPWVTSEVDTSTLEVSSDSISDAGAFGKTLLKTADKSAAKTDLAITRADITDMSATGRELVSKNARQSGVTPSAAATSASTATDVAGIVADHNTLALSHLKDNMAVRKAVAASACSLALITASFFGYVTDSVRLSEEGLANIIDCEGCNRQAYKDVAGVPTVGVGSTIGVVMGRLYTNGEIARRLARDVMTAEACLNRNLRIDLSQGEWDAYTSFVFNVGCSAFVSSTTFRILNGVKPGTRKDACEAMLMWNKVTINGRKDAVAVSDANAGISKEAKEAGEAATKRADQRKQKQAAKFKQLEKELYEKAESYDSIPLSASDVDILCRAYRSTDAYVQPPDNLTQETKGPSKVPTTVGELKHSALDLRLALDNCNIDKSEIRKARPLTTTCSGYDPAQDPSGKPPSWVTNAMDQGRLDIGYDGITHQNGLAVGFPTLTLTCVTSTVQARRSGFVSARSLITTPWVLPLSLRFRREWIRQHRLFYYPPRCYWLWWWSCADSFQLKYHQASTDGLLSCMVKVLHLSRKCVFHAWQNFDIYVRVGAYARVRDEAIDIGAVANLKTARRIWSVNGGTAGSGQLNTGFGMDLDAGRLIMATPTASQAASEWLPFFNNYETRFIKMQSRNFSNVCHAQQV